MRIEILKVPVDGRTEAYICGWRKMPVDLPTCYEPLFVLVQSHRNFGSVSIAFNSHDTHFYRMKSRLAKPLYFDGERTKLAGHAPKRSKSASCIQQEVAGLSYALLYVMRDSVMLC